MFAWVKLPGSVNLVSLLRISRVPQEFQCRFLSSFRAETINKMADSTRGDGSIERIEGGGSGGSGRQVIMPAGQAPPLAHYTPGIKVGDTLYISGQLGIDGEGKLVDDNCPVKQTTQAMENMGAVLKAAGMDYGNLVKCTVFLANINDGKEVNDAYKQFMPENPPARSMFAVAGLPRGAKVEIEAIAVKSKL